MPSLLLLESAGNQAYIFAANRLRQNVGASELTFRSCGRWVLEEVGELTGQSLWSADTRDRAANLLIAEPIAKARAEVLVAASGQALVLFRDPAEAREVLWKVTHRALRDAPALRLTGVVVEEDGRGLHNQVQCAARELARTSDRLPAPTARFRRVPLVRDCATSGLPAETLERTEDGRRLLAVEPRAPYERTHEPLSAAARAKWRAANGWFERLSAEKAITARDRLPQRLEELESPQQEPWIGVVHADGNGIGALFSKFDKLSGARDDEEYGARLRAFSLGLELTALEAFDQALKALPERGEGRPPVVPVILGGDDVTALVEGACAVRFGHAYVEAWRELSRGPIDPVGGVVSEIAGGGLTARAGVAIVKPHFPFHAAYGLCKALADGAKLRDASGGPVGAVDFHVLHDASDAAIDRIRDERKAADDGRLWAGPYAVGSGGPDGPRPFAELRQRVEAMRAQDDEGRRRLSGALLHRLRASLFQGVEAADAELALARPVYDQDCLERLTYMPAAGAASLVDRSEGNGRWRTAYLDALDLLDLWDGWES